MYKKMVIAFVVIILYCSILSAQSGNNQSGIVAIKFFGGYGLSWFTDLDNGDPRDSFQLGISIAVQKDLILNPEFGLRYINKGYKLDYIVKNQWGLPVGSVEGFGNFHFIDPFLRLRFQKLSVPLEPYVGISYAGLIERNREVTYSGLQIENEKDNLNSSSSEAEANLLLGMDYIFYERFVVNLEYIMGFAKIGYYGSGYNTTSVHLTRAVTMSFGVLLKI